MYRTNDIPKLINFIDSSNTDLYEPYVKAINYKLNGDSDRAMELSEKLLKNNQCRNSNAASKCDVLLSRIFLNNNNLKEARNVLYEGKKLLNKDSYFENIVYNLQNLDINYQKGNAKQVHKIFSRLSDNIKILKNKGGIDSDKAPIRFLEALVDLRESQLLLNASEYQEAKKCISNELREFSKSEIDSDIYREIITLRLYLLGKSEFFLHNYKVAEEFFNKIINDKEKIQNTDLEVRVKLYIGRISYYERNLDKALSIFEECRQYYEKIDDGVGSCKVYNEIGKVLHAKNKLNEAYEAYGKSKNISKRYFVKFEAARANMGLGIIDIRKNKYDLAEKKLLKSLDDFKKLENLRYTMRVVQYLGELETVRNHFKEAEEYYNRAYKMMEGKPFLKVEKAILDRHAARMYSKKNDIYKSLSRFNSSINVLKKRRCINSKIHRIKACIDKSFLLLISHNGKSDKDEIKKCLMISSRTADNYNIPKGKLRVIIAKFLITLFTKEYNEAFKNFEKAIILSRRIGDMSNELNLIRNIIEDHLGQFTDVQLLDYLIKVQKYDLRRERYINKWAIINSVLNKIYIDYPQYEIKMKYEIKINQYKKLIQTELWEKVSLTELDDIRLYAIKIKSANPALYSSLYLKSRDIMLHYINRKFIELPLHKDKDNFDEMYLYHLELRLKGNDSRGLDELAAEYLQTKKEAIVFSNKAMGALT